jgi:predicted AlkP superfamily phosphohydrolase/phosphomutase
MRNLIDSLYELEYNGNKAINKVLKKEKIYKVSQVENAPDLVCIENPGFRLKGSIWREKIFESDIFTGKHNNEAFLLTNNELKLTNPKVEDIVKYII